MHRMKINQILETPMFRGIGLGSNSNIIEWWSTSQELAKGYANRRENGNVLERDINAKNPVNYSHDSKMMNPVSFVGQALKQAKRGTFDMDVAKEKATILRNHFGDGNKMVSDYWKDEKSKRIVVDFLRSLGFDSIKILEDGVETYGLFK